MACDRGIARAHTLGTDAAPPDAANVLYGQKGSAEGTMGSRLLGSA